MVHYSKARHEHSKHQANMVISEMEEQKEGEFVKLFDVAINTIELEKEVALQDM